MTTRRAAALAAALAACAHGGSPSGPAVLERQPALAPLRPFAAPVPVVRALPGGLTVLAVERRSALLEAVVFVSRAGSARDPAGCAGASSLLGELLQAGAAGRGALQIAGEAAALGGEIRSEVRRDDLSLSLAVLPEKAPAAAALLADVVTRPTLDPGELGRLRQERLAELLALSEDPHHLADLAFWSSLYRGHPYAPPPMGTAATVGGLGPAELRAAYARLVPASSAVVLAGPLPAGEALAIAERAFAGWRPPAAGAGPPPGPPPGERPRLVIVDRPGAPQSVLMVGESGPPRASPDSLPLRVANQVLGGSFLSRLNANLRERHGYTYGAGSRFRFGAGPGPFAARSDVKTDVTAAALGELLAELRAIVAAPLDAEELAKGKALVAAELVSILESSEETALAFADLWSSGAPLDEFARVLPALDRLGARQVQEALRRALHPGSMTVVVVGDARVVTPSLAPLSLGPPLPWTGLDTGGASR